MAGKATRLRFTEDELENPKLRRSEAAAGCREGRPGSGPGGPRCRENPEKAQTEIKYGSEVTAQGALNL